MASRSRIPGTLRIDPDVAVIPSETEMSDDEIAALRERFKQRTADEAKVLRNSLERGEFGAAEVERLAHTLAGTGGLLGFPAVAADAAVVDYVFAAGEIPTLESLEKLLASMEATGLEN